MFKKGTDFLWIGRSNRTLSPFPSENDEIFKIDVRRRNCCFGFWLLRLVLQTDNFREKTLIPPPPTPKTRELTSRMKPFNFSESSFWADRLLLRKLNKPLSIPIEKGENFKILKIPYVANWAPFYQLSFLEIFCTEKNWLNFQDSQQKPSSSVVLPP